MLIAGPLTAQPEPATDLKPSDDPMAVLGPREWEKVGEAIERALGWLASRQQPDGSFPTLETGQPAVTSLCVMAFLAGGHLPGDGPYGAQLERAVDYVLGCQQTSGLLARVNPRVNDVTVSIETAGHTAAYNHAISGVLLCEVYGMTHKDQARRIRSAIERALNFTMAEHAKPKRFPEDEGGWRYVYPTAREKADSDLSITCWQLMFLRSAINAGFEIPSEPIDQAVAYIKRCYKPDERVLTYTIIHPQAPTRAMAGAGILALALGGLHRTTIAQSSAQWLLAHPFDRYNQSLNIYDRYHYGVYHCSLAMFQMGGRYWEGFYPGLTRVLLRHQSPAGHWETERRPMGDHIFGNAYTTALVVNALAVPYQLLPIYQR